MTTAPRKVINAWAMYDWSNSVYSLVISSTIFPAYFEAITGDGNDNTLQDRITLFGKSFVNTSLYNYALGVAFLAVAIMSPLLSSISDYRGNKKKFLFFFCSLGSIACCSLYFFNGRGDILFGLLAMIFACIGFWSSLVFYNSYLPEIAAPEDRDRVSARGFVMGYLGSVILQLICFIFVLSPETFHINTAQASRISFLLVGCWWLGFGQFSIRRLPAGTPSEKKFSGNILTQGYKELHKVWLQIKEMAVLKRFLLSFFFYNMGVQTIMLAATLYGKSELAIPTPKLIVSILIIQLVAIPGAALIARLSMRIGNFKTLALLIICWALLCVAGYRIGRGDIGSFYLLAGMVGFVMGGIQSLSRSTYSKIMPETHDTASFFSFYDVTEKLAIVIGMFSFGYINEVTGSQRNAVLALMTFFIIGLGILFLAMKKQDKFAAS